MVLHLNRLECPSPRMLCAKFGWNWPTGFWREFFYVVNVCSLFYICNLWNFVYKQTFKHSHTTDTWTHIDIILLNRGWGWCIWGKKYLYILIHLMTWSHFKYISPYIPSSIKSIDFRSRVLKEYTFFNFKFHF